MTLRVDGHQHFWTLQRDDYGWLTPDLETLYRDFSPQDLEPLLIELGIDKTIVVQAAPTVDETRYLLQLSEETDFIAGVVGWIDMDSPNEAIAALDEFVQHPKFVGVRPMIQDIEDPAWINKPELGSVLDAFVENEVCFDALVRSVHLPFLLSCLTRHPELRVVIDHGAKPNIAAGEWQPWADSIAAIANQTTAYCKISGLITEADQSQNYDDLARYVDHLLDVFGPKRLIWGSDWPVLNLAGDYRGWHTASRSMLSGLSSYDLDLVMGGNAARFYGTTES